jgi:hypothetical protein
VAAIERGAGREIAGRIRLAGRHVLGRDDRLERPAEAAAGQDEVDLLAPRSGHDRQPERGHHGAHELGRTRHEGQPRVDQLAVQRGLLRHELAQQVGGQGAVRRPEHFDEARRVVLTQDGS